MSQTNAINCDVCDSGMKTFRDYPKGWATIDWRDETGADSRNGRYDICDQCKVKFIDLLPARRKGES